MIYNQYNFIAAHIFKEKVKRKLLKTLRSFSNHCSSVLNVRFVSKSIYENRPNDHTYFSMYVINAKNIFFAKRGKICMLINQLSNDLAFIWKAMQAYIYSINSSCSKCADKMITFSSCIIYVDCKILRMSQSTSFHHENSTVPSSQIMVASLQDETENHRVVSYRRWSLPCYQ